MPTGLQTGKTVETADPPLPMMPSFTCPVIVVISSDSPAAPHSTDSIHRSSKVTFQCTLCGIFFKKQARLFNNVVLQTFFLFVRKKAERKEKIKRS